MSCVFLAWAWTKWAIRFENFAFTHTMAVVALALISHPMQWIYCQTVWVALWRHIFLYGALDASVTQIEPGEYHESDFKESSWEEWNSVSNLEFAMDVGCVKIQTRSHTCNLLHTHNAAAIKCPLRRDIWLLHAEWQAIWTSREARTVPVAIRRRLTTPMRRTPWYQTYAYVGKLKHRI